MNIKHLLLFAACALTLFPLCSCNDDDDKQAQAEYLKEQAAAFESKVNSLNASILCYQSLLSGELPVGITPEETGYKVELSGGHAYHIGAGEAVDACFPLISLSGKGDWTYSFNGTDFLNFTDPSGKTLNAYSLEDTEAAYRSPQLLIDHKGCWKMTCDGGSTYSYLPDASGKRAAAFGAKGKGLTSLFESIAYNETAGTLSLTPKASGKTQEFPVVSGFYLTIAGSETEEGRTFFLDEERRYEVKTGDVARTRINAPKGWTATLEGNELAVKSPAEASMEKTERIDIVITSSKQYQRTVTLEAKLINTTFDAAYCNAWKEFASGTEENVLPDFSYAGYMHGEVAPPDVETSGYQLINVCDFGAVPNDGQSDRQAFIDAIASIKGVQKTVGNVKPGTNGGAASQTIRLLNNKPSNAIIYFPEGEFILQDESEVNQTIDITMSNLVIKGAGREQTIIRMDSKNKLTNGRDMWTSPCMIQLKHYSGPSDLCDVTGNADKGSHEVAVSSTTGIRAGDWVCLSLLNNNPDLVAEEVAPHPASDLNTAIVSIAQEGVEVIDYHQVAAVGNNKLTFAEPIMRKVEAKYGWKIKKYPHYENIGVEDLTFQGKAEEKFQHHEPSTGAGTSFDGDYKLIDFTRLTNSWMRRVNFVSVSEALSITSSANVSAYDIKISGNRGHSAVRSASSSRVFIGKVTDQSDGYRIPKAGQLAEFMKGAGQYHGCGVSKPSMGAVIWNVRWGEDGCYEAHASQPRATLIDRCTGAFIPSRQGGSEYEVPNHLGDLIIWNMNATRAGYESEWGNRFVFWDKNSKWCKTVPPVIIGFHGASINFAETYVSNVKQVKRLESMGTQVEPYSLYEAQLRRRLGYVPSWLSALK